MITNIPAGTPVAEAVLQAQKAMAAHEYRQAGVYYQQALSYLDGSQADSAIRYALWIEHVGQLIKYEQLHRAVEEAKVYIIAAQMLKDRPAEVKLSILLTEALVAQNDWEKGRQALDCVNLWVREYSDWEQQLGQQAFQLIRLWGLFAGEQGDLVRARLLLQEAANAFAAANHISAHRTVLNDLRRLELLAGNAAVLEEIFTVQDVQNTNELLLIARALRRDARYEAASRLLEQRFQWEVEPALRFPLLHELILLYQILSQQERVEHLLPLLAEAADWAADPSQARAITDRLRCWQSAGFTLNADMSFEGRLFQVRARIQNHELQQAEHELLLVRSEATTPRLATYWFVVAGELEIANGLQSSPSQAGFSGQQALAHLNQAAEQALASSLPDVYSYAVRLKGKVYAHLLNDLDTASQFWAQAGQGEELIAHRQETDQTRIRYLESRPTEYDELIMASAARVTVLRRDLIAGVIAALETARGSTILSSILPNSAFRMRDVPSPNDPVACLYWIEQSTKRLPSNMAIWLLHATPDQIHHGLIGHGLLQWVKVRVNRYQLGEMIDELKSCWGVSASLLEDLVQDDPSLMPTLLSKVAHALQIEKVLASLPSKITRLAIIAGDALGDIPFAALPLHQNATSAHPLITRFALSYLPCLSAQQSLAERTVGARGEYSLVVRPPTDDLPTLSSDIDHKQICWLKDSAATITTVDNLLKTRQFPLVRFDCHGHYGRDMVLNSWLQLAKDQVDDGRLTVQHFQNLSLKHCGTLMLGACESGMSHRRGRDEREGFVRAGFLAGASAVLAARWVAENTVANTILNRFQQYLYYLPRDQALQRVQLGVIQGCYPELQTYRQQLKSKSIELRPEHIARWACWTLYGDAGLQTQASWPTRMIRRLYQRLKGA